MKKIDAELFFVIDEKNNTIELTDKGIDLVSGKDDRNFFVMPDIGDEIAKLQKQNLEKDLYLEQKDGLVREYSIKSERIHSINQLLKAYTLFEKEVEYVILDGKVKIVDESTGRILEGRRYSDGLHQAIEAKENVEVEAATQTYATVTLQNYFRMYHKLAGMTGTAETEAKEFWDIYQLDVVIVPTNRAVSRQDQDDFVYKSAREKYNAVIQEVEELVAAGRPVLVGTTTVEISELVSRMLQMKKIPHQVLNAKYHQKEAEIVANAGLAGAVTIATNMAGRGTDIKLGEGVKEAGGLAIIGTERHDSRRVDRQLRGRAGRQGLAVTLAEFRDQRRIYAIESFTRKRFDEKTVEGMEPSRRPSHNGGGNDRRGNGGPRRSGGAGFGGVPGFGANRGGGGFSGGRREGGGGYAPRTDGFQGRGQFGGGRPQESRFEPRSEGRFDARSQGRPEFRDDRRFEERAAPRQDARVDPRFADRSDRGGRFENRAPRPEGRAHGAPARGRDDRRAAPATVGCRGEKPLRW